MADAQIGSGWTQQTYTKAVHLDNESGLQTFSWASYRSVGSGTICADYQGGSSAWADTTETFRILDNRSNRSEIRIYNDYSTGSRQFQGYVTFSSPLNDECLMQVWGSTSGATQMMIRGFSASGGTLREGSTVLATSCYGVEKRVNVIHYQGNYFEIWINGSEKKQFNDTEDVSNYWKYGCYGTLTTGPVTVQWRQVRCYSK
ncbi:hypothetical protein KBB96_11225 [Luteolibacter ambystomatis]|uniref:Alginate lyase 2 domain-containing protein n=1 Tax=Luteolibacter ambystomatis TaxID=2824561 RepID=A0A975G504_9BACT|nr:hypothetical protein [Luteolibacter ambystomatis]QUE49444.1 hypothetical protein KBB96_11225 [Luteolibacter ambystomatis]